MDLKWKYTAVLALLLINGAYADVGPWGYTKTDSVAHSVKQYLS
ncbi:MAG: hypothetical protein WAX07_01720 [Candidatus Altiarchaeia archaeon]